MSQLVSANENGFTAVELLITLFIAAVFLFAGYQLYTQVTRDGTDAQHTARISNLVYERLRKAESTLDPSGCSSGSTVTENNVPVQGFSDVDFVITVSCPFQTSSGTPIGVSYVKVSATYTDGASTKVMTHGTYLN